VTNVRRNEEPLRVLLDKHLLHPKRRVAPDGEPAVAVVIVHERDERLLVPHEERRCPMAQSFGRLGQRETELTDPIKCVDHRYLDSVNGSRIPY